ncbi:hypothetical protein HaLaN_05667 [Haematococcus lacustris]|uniref:Uncharacterized protein n=1 Tax=Haematococcus lacustris TaxID=44745 RepID=A0A699YJG5_HAELA|nr:hypothetical protein HaLaN_05667 [Haematococcus lacustris]
MACVTQDPLDPGPRAPRRTWGTLEHFVTSNMGARALTGPRWERDGASDEAGPSGSEAKTGASLAAPS